MDFQKKRYLKRWGMYLVTMCRVQAILKPMMNNNSNGVVIISFDPQAGQNVENSRHIIAPADVSQKHTHTVTKILHLASSFANPLDSAFFVIFFFFYYILRKNYLPT